MSRLEAGQRSTSVRECVSLVHHSIRLPSFKSQSLISTPLFKDELVDKTLRFFFERGICEGPMNLSWYNIMVVACAVMARFSL